jgi:hypothetical protein
VSGFSATRSVSMVSVASLPRQVLSAFAPSGEWGTLPAHCGDWNGMRRSVCGSAAISERPERTTQGYRRYRRGTCGKQFNERSVGVLDRAQYPSDVIALVVFWRLHYKLSLRALAEMFLTRGFIFSYEAVRDWEASGACREPASATQRQGWPKLVG